jgi:phosphohistidine swiveling domain-containing protein
VEKTKFFDHATWGLAEDLIPLGGGPTPLVSKELAGGKGANLVEMASLGLPVPPGIVIPTTYCNVYKGLTAYPATQKSLVHQLAKASYDYFTQFVVGDGYIPLLSVRSGARVSMPGMMDTLLNVGLNVGNYWYWEDQLGAECAKDCGHRLNEMFQKTCGANPPDNTVAQLEMAIEAVFKSWDSERAIEYRAMHGYPENWGTAVTVQAMVFGNLNDKSGSGVLFTRDPATGEDFVTGEFLVNAQGEDVVSGVRTPRPLHEMEDWNEPVLDQLLTISGKLEAHYKDAQDVEFTVQDGKLYILQTRNAKRTAAAAFKIAHDLAVAGSISKKDAVKRVTSAQYHALSREMIDPEFTGEPTVTGLAASPGLVRGPVVFTKEAVSKFQNPILVRPDTCPEDFPAMVKSAAILTSTGGATSHAAVVARGINKPAVVGATGITMITATHAMFGSTLVAEGDFVSIDGATGRVWLGAVPTLTSTPTEEAEEVLRWATEAANLITVHSVESGGQLPERGSSYLSVCSLSKAKEYRELFKVLLKKPHLRGMIGFGRPKHNLTAEDAQYLSLLTLTGVHQGSADVGEFINAATGKTLTKKLKAKWTIHPPRSIKDSEVDALVDAGWKVVRPVRTLKDLFAADGLVEFDDDFKTRMESEKLTIQEVLVILDRAGRKVSEIGALVSPEDFVNEALGK